VKVGRLNFYRDTHSVAIVAPQGLSASSEITLPEGLPSNTKLLAISPTGQISYVDAGGGDRLQYTFLDQNTTLQPNQGYAFNTAISLTLPLGGPGDRIGLLQAPGTDTVILQPASASVLIQGQSNPVDLIETIDKPNSVVLVWVPGWGWEFEDNLSSKGGRAVLPFLGWQSPDAIFYAATEGLSQDWTNPHISGRVTVSMSTIELGTLDLAVSQDEANISRDQWQLYSQNTPDSHLTIEFDAYQVRPTGIAYRSLLAGHVPRTFKFQASTDGLSYVDLASYNNDTSSQLSSGGVPRFTYFSLPTPPANYYKFFRFLANGANNTGQYRAGGQFRIYGSLRAT